MQAVPACRQALTFGKTYSNQERARNTLSLVGLGDGGVAHGRGHHPEQEAAIQRHCTNERMRKHTLGLVPGFAFGHLKPTAKG